MANDDKHAKMSKTLAGVQTPVRSTPPGGTPAPAVIGADELFEAWNAHTEILRGVFDVNEQVLEAIRRNEEDNRATRRSARRSSTASIVALLVAAIVGASVYRKVDRSADAMVDLEMGARAALVDLAKTRREMKLVSEAMVMTNEASLVAVPPESGDTIAGVPEPDSQVVVESKKARVAAMTASLQARIALSENGDEPKREKAVKALAEMKTRAKALGADIDDP